MNREMNQDQFSLDRMAQDPKNWWGPFYGCRKDKRLFVPKLVASMGWTLNMSNPFTYLVIFGIVVIAIVYHYLS